MVAADSRRDTDLLIYSKRNRMSSPNGMTSGFLVSVCQEKTVLSGYLFHPVYFFVAGSILFAARETRTVRTTSFGRKIRKQFTKRGQTFIPSPSR